MPGTLFQLPKPTAWDVGATQAGAKLYFYETNTSTPQNTYTDVALTTAHANPVVADSEGIFAPIYLDPSLPDYRVTFTDSADTTIYQVDDVPAGPAGSSAYTLSGGAPYLDLVEDDATSNNGVWRIQASGETLYIYAMNDAKSASNTVFSCTRSTTTPSVMSVYGGEIATVVSSTFTGTLTGYASGPTGTITYTIFKDSDGTGKMCNLWAKSAITGTSNANTLTMTGIPSACQPSTAILVPCVLQDNTTNVTGGVAISGGTATFSMGSPLSASGFTGSGSKGFTAGWSITYPL